MPTTLPCSRCGNHRPDPAPSGLCPQCLAEAAAEKTRLTTHASAEHAARAANHGTPAVPPLDSSVPGEIQASDHRRFGDYELIEEIARGGMGVVYRARQAGLNRPVAVKMILSGSLASPDEVQRFRTEAEAAANLQHPNIVAIHEVGEHEGRHYFSMDYIEGKNLADAARARPFSDHEAAALMRTLALAVHYAHQRGTLHRDLKPQNVLLDSLGHPRITDFGLAKQMTRDDGLTRTGAVLGSPGYMAPELAAGRHDRVGPATDVYSLGAILYELLAGRPPFRGETPMSTLMQVIEASPLAPRKMNPAISSDLETICLTCLEKTPGRRYASARLLADDLERFINHEPILARPASRLRQIWSWGRKHPWVVTGVLSVLFLGLIGVAFGLQQQVRFLKWKLAHPGADPSVGATLISPAFGIFLAVEFFLLQSLPLLKFVHKRAPGRMPRRRLGLFISLAVLQISFGIYLLFQGVSASIWAPHNWFQNWGLLVIPAVSNGWFGSLLLWFVLRESQRNSALVHPGALPAATSVPQRKPASVAIVLCIQIVLLSAVAYFRNGPVVSVMGYWCGAVGVLLFSALCNAGRLFRGAALSALFPGLLLTGVLSLGFLAAPLRLGIESLLLGLVNALIFIRFMRVRPRS